MARKIKILTDVDGKQDLAVSGALTVKADSTFVIPSISTSSDGFYSLNNAIHKIDQSLQEVNARVVSSVGNVLGQYNASRYVFSGYFNASGSATINLTRGSPSGSVYFTESEIGNLSVNILTDYDGDGIFTNNLVPFQLRPASGDLFLDISAPSAPYVMYKATVTNDSAIVDIPAQNDVYLVQNSGSSKVDGTTVYLDKAQLYSKTIRNLYVSPTGSNDNDGLTLTSSLATIQEAINRVPVLSDSATTRSQFHTIINVASGTYTEKVNIFGKGYAGSISSLLMLIKGDREFLYQNLTATAVSTTDPESGDESGDRAVTLNFATNPATNSLKGCFLLRPNKTAVVITGNSGSQCYITADFSTVSAANSFMPAANEVVSIYRPATQINGYFRCVGNEGVISFKDLRINLTTNDAGGNNAFGISGVNYVIGNVDEDFTNVLDGNAISNSYAAYGKDMIRAENCQMVRQSGSIFYLGPRTYFIGCYISGGALPTYRVAVVEPGEAFSFIRSFSEDVSFTINYLKFVAFTYSHIKGGLIDMIGIGSGFYPKKLVGTSASNYMRIQSTPSFNMYGETYIKNYRIRLGNKSAAGILASPQKPCTFHGFFTNIIDADDSRASIYGGNFSGSLPNGSKLLSLTNKSFVQFLGQINISGVYLAETASLIKSVQSDIYFQSSLPVTAAVGSANYRANGDIDVDNKIVTYLQLPIITAEGSKIEYTANTANAKLDYQYALETNKNITLTGSAQLISSLVKLTPYTTLPTGSLGLMAVSGTTLYFHNGTNWRAVI